MNESKQVLWTGDELTQLLNTKSSGPVQNIHRVIIDSREAEEGDLFVALSGDPGPRFNPSRISDRNGHDYVEDAKNRGATACIVEQAVKSKLATYRVADTYDALWTIARKARTKLSDPVAAVTGSSGKTTFKNFFVQGSGGYGSPASFNNHIGVPLSLANAPHHSRGPFIFEIGTNHAGEISPLSEIVDPDLAVLLNVHQAHIGNFDSLEQLRNEKFSISNPDKTEALFVCDEKLKLYAPKGSYFFGNSSESHSRILSVSDGTMHLNLLGEKLTANIPGGGQHRALTMSAVLLAQKLLGLDISESLELTEEAIPEGRGNETKVSGITIVDDSYNANPESMLAALTFMTQDKSPGRKIAVLGEMLELGNITASEHKKMAKVFSAFDKVFLVGEGFKETDSSGWFPEANTDLIAEVEAYAKPGDKILIKGSNRIFWAKNFVDKLVESMK